MRGFFARRAVSAQSCAFAHLQPWGRCPNPPEFSALGQWAFCEECRGPGEAVPQHRGISPFGNVHRSGCPPAEPYPADDARLLLEITSTPVASSAILQKSSFAPSPLSSFEPSLSSFAPAPTGISEKIADPDHPQISPHDDSLAPSHGKMPPQIPIECFVPCRLFNHSKQNPSTQK